MACSYYLFVVSCLFVVLAGRVSFRSSSWASNSGTGDVEQALGSVIADMRGTMVGARCMRSSRKKYEPTDWRFTMEQIGRELQKVYPAREQLERKITGRIRDRRLNAVVSMVSV